MLFCYFLRLIIHKNHWLTNIFFFFFLWYFLFFLTLILFNFKFCIFLFLVSFFLLRIWNIILKNQGLIILSLQLRALKYLRAIIRKFIVIWSSISKYLWRTNFFHFRWCWLFLLLFLYSVNFLSINYYYFLSKFFYRFSWPFWCFFSFLKSIIPFALSF